MTTDKKKLLENFIRKEVRKSLNEDSKNLKTVSITDWFKIYRELSLKLDQYGPVDDYRYDRGHIFITFDLNDNKQKSLYDKLKQVFVLRDV